VLCATRVNGITQFCDAIQYDTILTCAQKLTQVGLGTDFRFEVPGQSSVGLISGGRGQWLGGTMASAEHEPKMGVRGEAP